MIGANVVSVFLFSGLMTLNVPSPINMARGRNAPIVMVQAAAQKSPSAARHSGQKVNGPKMGDWLQAHKDLPLDQQLKLLENDPGFKKLPPQRQAALRERLQKFNSLPPEKRDQAVRRMEFLATLTPQQRHSQLAEINPQPAASAQSPQSK